MPLAKVLAIFAVVLFVPPWPVEDTGVSEAGALSPEQYHGEPTLHLHGEPVVRVNGWDCVCALNV